MSQTIINSSNLLADLRHVISSIPHDRLFLLSDSNVEAMVFPLLDDFFNEYNPVRIILPPGEEYKNLESLSKVWECLAAEGGSRKSLLINLGGGVVTDLGGFAAACFKRGIRFVNIPTTLLSAVDAAVGGKTGIDFNGLKNEIGAFAPAEAVILSTAPFATLPDFQMASGFAEIVKMAMISSPEVYAHILRLSEDNALDLRASGFPLGDLVNFSVMKKAEIVEQDPNEKGLRKILNFGHTCGHAFESFLLKKGTPIPHGEAVAYGILVALILSNLRLKADSRLIHQYKSHILAPLFSPISIKCDDIDPLIDIMKHDKKNVGGKITFVLLSAIGDPVIDSDTPEEDIRAALDIFIDME